METRNVQRFFVYHSPQYPGYTCWCGLWLMPDNSVMCSFTQATGPVNGRPRAPERVRQELVWPPPGHCEEYDMTGLLLENVHLRSTDQGRTWSRTGSDSFRTCMNGITGEAETALADHTLVRGVWGRYLPYDDVPQDGYLQRSTDLGRTWSGPELIQQDPDFAFWPKRLRVLRDGRLLAGGGLFRRHPQEDIRTRWCDDFVPALYVSGNGGRSWQGPIPVVAADQRAGFSLTEEFDWVELEDGDLLLVLRAGVEEGRLQTRMRRRDSGWETTRVEPNGLPYSGHPELLLTRERYLLHVATTGIACSRDQGNSWQELLLDDGVVQVRREPATPYYPKAVQLAAGEVVVVGHVGGDDGYGCVDQSIVGVRFAVSA